MKFNDYVIIGDYVEYIPENNNPRGFIIRTTIKEDYDTTPKEFDCYDQSDIDAWRNDNWFFCGVVLSVWKNGVCLSDNAASLWGVECNFPNASNDYLLEVIKELENEALKEAENILQKLID